MAFCFPESDSVPYWSAHEGQRRNNCQKTKYYLVDRQKDARGKRIIETHIKYKTPGVQQRKRHFSISAIILEATIGLSGARSVIVCVGVSQ